MMEKTRYWMRMDGRAPWKVLHHNFKTQEGIFKLKVSEAGLWVPIFRNWYKPNGKPMNSNEIREQRNKELDIELKELNTPSQTKR